MHFLMFWIGFPSTALSYIMYNQYNAKKIEISQNY